MDKEIEEKNEPKEDSGEEEVSKPTINQYFSDFVVARGCTDEHYWIEDWWDSGEDRQHVICSKPDCWMGRYLQKDEHIEDGKVVNNAV